MPILLLPDVPLPRAEGPSAMFEPPVVLSWREEAPIPILLVPPVLLMSASKPMATL